MGREWSASDAPPAAVLLVIDEAIAVFLAPPGSGATVEVVVAPGSGPKPWTPADGFDLVAGAILPSATPMTHIQMRSPAGD